MTPAPVAAVPVSAVPLLVAAAVVLGSVALLGGPMGRPPARRRLLPGAPPAPSGWSVPAIGVRPRWPGAARRAEARIVDDLPGALDLTSRALRSGASIDQALDAAASGTDGPLAADLRAVVDRARAGVGTGPALERWAAERDLAPVRLVVAALLVGAETGASPARAVDAVATTVRERQTAAHEARAQSTQARASVGLLVAAPPVFAVLASLIDPRVGALLLGEPLGWLCLAAGLGLDGAGAAWMVRLVRAAR